MSTSKAKADAYFERISALMDAAGDEGEMSHADFARLMMHVSQKAIELSRRKPAGEGTTPEHRILLAQCLPVRTMAGECALKGHNDEVLLHLGMLGVYLDRLADHPIMRLEMSDMTRIREALIYHYDGTPHFQDDSENRKLAEFFGG